MTQFKIAVCVCLQNEANFSSPLQRALRFAREVGALNGLSPERSQYACYFAWQLRAQVWAWLSHERFGVLFEALMPSPRVALNQVSLPG